MGSPGSHAGGSVHALVLRPRGVPRRLAHSAAGDVAFHLLDSGGAPERWFASQLFQITRTLPLGPMAISAVLLANPFPR